MSKTQTRTSGKSFRIKIKTREKYENFFFQLFFSLSFSYLLCLCVIIKLDQHLEEKEKKIEHINKKKTWKIILQHRPTHDRLTLESC
jgi:hypothetical protein